MDWRKKITLSCQVIPFGVNILNYILSLRIMDAMYGFELCKRFKSLFVRMKSLTFNLSKYPGINLEGTYRTSVGVSYTNK